jgi:hypothetical protein
MHARHPVHLADEPINVDSTLLNGAQLAATRTCLSILTHNQIIIGEEGAVAEQTEDVGELGMEDTALGDECNAIDFMTDNYDDQLFSAQNPLTAGAFPSFDDPTFFDPEGSLAFLDDANDTNQVWLLEDWIGELMKQGR